MMTGPKIHAAPDAMALIKVVTEWRDARQAMLDLASLNEPVSGSHPIILQMQAADDTLMDFAHGLTCAGALDIQSGPTWEMIRAGADKFEKLVPPDGLGTACDPVDIVEAIYREMNVHLLQLTQTQFSKDGTAREEMLDGSVMLTFPILPVI